MIFPMSLWVRPAFSLISLRKTGIFLYIKLCCDLVAINIILESKCLDTSLVLK